MEYPFSRTVIQGMLTQYLYWEESEFALCYKNVKVINTVFMGSCFTEWSFAKIQRTNEKWTKVPVQIVVSKSIRPRHLRRQALRGLKPPIPSRKFALILPLAMKASITAPLPAKEWLSRKLFVSSVVTRLKWSTRSLTNSSKMLSCNAFSLCKWLIWRYWADQE